MHCWNRSLLFGARFGKGGGEVNALKLSELAQGIRKMLKELLLEESSNGSQTLGTEARYLLDITGVRFEHGISCRKSCIACFDVRYAHEADGRIDFAGWTEIMSRRFTDISVDGKILHTSKRSSRSEGGFFHFTFEVRADYIEYEPAETMISLEVTGFGKSSSR